MYNNTWKINLSPVAWSKVNCVNSDKILLCSTLKQCLITHPTHDDVLYAANHSIESRVSSWRTEWRKDRDKRLIRPQRRCSLAVNLSSQMVWSECTTGCFGIHTVYQLLLPVRQRGLHLLWNSNVFLIDFNHFYNVFSTAQHICRERRNIWVLEGLVTVVSQISKTILQLKQTIDQYHLTLSSLECFLQFYLWFIFCNLILYSVLWQNFYN